MQFVKVPNPDVLKAGVAHAEADLKHWNQDSWLKAPWNVQRVDYDPALDAEGRPACGTASCLAGHILLADGMTWEQIVALDKASEMDDQPGIAEAALDVLGFVSSDSDDGLAVGHREDFMFLIFEHTINYDIGEEKHLAYTQEALDLLKARITQYTGITFDDRGEGA